MNQTITIPSWLYKILQGLYHGWGIFVGAILTAIIVSAVVYMIKNHYWAKKAQALEQATLHKLLLGITAVLTGLQYYIPYLQQHLRTLETLPYIGSYMVGIYAAANFLYALRLKKWFQIFTNWASKESNTAITTPAESSTPTVPNQQETAADFEV